MTTKIELRIREAASFRARKLAMMRSPSKKKLEEAKNNNLPDNRPIGAKGASIIDLKK